MHRGTHDGAWLLAVALLSLASISPAVGKDLKVVSTWASPTMAGENLRSGWPEPETVLLDKQDVLIRVANDSDHVFFMLGFKNPEWAHLIRLSGLTIWLDGRGDKGKDFKLHFVGGPSMRRIMASSGQNGADFLRQMPPGLREQMKQRDTSRVDSFTCYQKEYYVEEPIPTDGTKGPRAVYGIDNGYFIYEFSVPLEKSSVKIYGLGVPPDRTISLGLTWGEIDRKKMMDDMPDRDEGFFSGDIGGSPTGGRPEGRGGVPPGGWMGGHMPKKQEVWLNVRLTPSAQTPHPAPKR